VYVPGALPPSLSRKRSGRSSFGCDQHHPRRVGHTADLDRLLDKARLGVHQDRAAAHQLLDRGGQVGLVFGVAVELCGQPRKHAWRARELLEAPRKLRCGRLVAGHQRRHQLVAQLLV
jgi:hypothetical protein